jgi:RNA polymerase sigma factor (sigma-70 family)
LELTAELAEEAADEVVALDEALEEFARLDPAKAELVQLRYFAGLSVEEAAEMLGISRATADRHWRYAKTWLYCAMTRRTRPEPE